MVHAGFNRYEGEPMKKICSRNHLLVDRKAVINASRQYKKIPCLNSNAHLRAVMW
jgi:hypothetical protein